MAGIRVAIAAAVGLWASHAQAAPPRPNLAHELAACQKQHGTTPALPLGEIPPNGLTASANVLTPAEAPGAVTVNPKAAACLIEAMGDELFVLAPMKDPEGIRDAWAMPGVGVSREPTPEERTALKTIFGRTIGGRPERPVLVYCHHTSCALSFNAIHHLRAAGYTNLLWMREGIKGWREAGLPVGLTRQNGARQLPDVAPRAIAWSDHGDHHYPLPPGRFDDARYEPLKTAGLSVKKLCGAVGMGVKDPAGDGLWEISLLEKAAGVDRARDNDVAVRRKMQAFWARWGDLLECRLYLSDRRVSVLKVSAGQPDSVLLDRALVDWRLPAAAFNKLDPGDGRTVLDYVEGFHNAVSAPKERVKRQFRELRAAGAKTADELIAAGQARPPRALQAEYLSLYRKRADAGDVDAMFHLSEVHRRGLHAPVDWSEGMRWWRMAEQRAIDTNDHQTLLHIGQVYFLADGAQPGDIKADPARAFDLIRRALVARETAQTLFWAGRAHLNGIGTPRDPRKGIDYLQRSYALKQDAVAALWIARGYAELGDWKAMGPWLRVSPQLHEIQGARVEDWFAKAGISFCGPRPGMDPIVCDGSNSRAPGMPGR